MTIRSKGARAVAILVLMMGILSAISRAAAQDVGDLGTDTGATGTVVGVSCSYDQGTDLTTCDFAATSDAGVVSTLLVPYEAVCGTVVATAAEVGDAGYTQDVSSGALAITVAGLVSVGGSATFGVVVDGANQDVIGDATVCGGDPGSLDIEPQDPTTEATEETGDGTPEATVEPTVEATEEAVASPEPTETEPTPDGDGSSVPESNEAPVEDVTVNVVAYDCAVDPGDSDPAASADCSVSVGVDISGTADSSDIGTQTTDGSGVAAFSAPNGSLVTLIENSSTVPTGYHPVAGGVASVTASDGAWVTFVHLASDVVGRLQIVSGTCPTSGEGGVVFRVIEPRTVSAASAPACSATDNVSFTISGGPYEGFVITTGPDGAWRGYLPPAEYTVQAETGETASVNVVADNASVVIAVNYVAAPQGVLNLSRFVCEGADQTNIVIDVQYDEPTVGDDDGCEPSDAQVTVDVLSEVSTASVTTVQLGGDGVEEIELPSGSYLVTDVLSGESVSVDLKPSSRLYVVIQDLALGGDGVGTDDPDDGGENPGGGNGGPGGGDPNQGSDGDGTGSEVPGDNSGGSATGGDDTSGGVNAGADDDSASGDEIASVTTLPVTGSRPNQQRGFESVMLLIAALALVIGGGIATRKRRFGSRAA